MPTFEFQAKHPDGTLESGNVIGASLEAALSDLGRRGLSVEKISVVRLMNDPLNQDQTGGSPSQFAPQVPAAVADPAPHSVRQGDPVSPPPVGAPVPPQYERPNSTAGATEGLMEGQGVNPQGQRVMPDLGQRSFVQTNVVGPIAAKIPIANLGFMFRQLGTMLNAGVPIVQSLETLAGQAKHPQQKQLTFEMANLAKEGLPISGALQRYPESISPVMISMVRAGEEGGFLDAALHQVADYIDREVELWNLFKRSTFYPKLVFFASFLIIAVTNFIISSLGKQGGLASPISVGTWIMLAIVFGGFWLFTKVGLADMRIKYWWDRYSLKVPILGKTLHELAMARFGRAFGALYKAGVPISKAMPLSADASGNEFLRSQMYPWFRRMEEGGGIFETLQSTGVFSPIVLDMIGTGEKTGNMEQMVTKVAEYYEQEAITRQNALAAASGVFLVVLVGIYIGFMVIKFYTGSMYGGQIQQAASGASDGND
jgi:type II secretory pathway component PulF